MSRDSRPRSGGSSASRSAYARTIASGRPQLVGDERDELAAGLVDRLERLDPCLGLGLLATLLDDPGEQVGDRAELRDVVVAEGPRLLGLDVEDADGLVVPGQRHGQHRRHEAALVDAADPQEARVGPDVRDDQGFAAGGDAAGHALAERHARPADLEPVEAVGRGQRQVRSVPVEQVERGDIRVQDVPGPVDDGLEQLVPRPGRRREAGHLVQEAELFELVVGGRGGIGRPRTAPRTRLAGLRGAGSDARHGHHHTSLEKGCGRKVAVRWWLGPGTVPPEWPRESRRRFARNASVGAGVGGGRRGAARDRVGRRARPARARGPAARRAARPGHRRAGRPGAVRDRRTHPTPDDRPPTRRRPGRTGATRRRAARARPRRRGGRHRGVRAVLRARQPGRGARSGADVAAARARVARRRPGGLAGRRGRRVAAAWSDGCGAGCAGRPARRRAGLHGPPDRGAPPDDARRARPVRDPPGPAGRPAPDPVGRSRGAAAPARGDHDPVADVRPARRVARRRSTRSGRRWRSSTRRCSRSSRGCTGRSMRRWMVRAAAVRRRRPPTPAGRGRGRRASGRSCGRAAGSAATATATRA